MKRLQERIDAMLAGKDRYFTGKVCKNGHVDERYVANNTCLGCEKQIRARYLARKATAAAPARRPAAIPGTAIPTRSP